MDANFEAKSPKFIQQCVSIFIKNMCWYAKNIFSIKKLRKKEYFFNSFCFPSVIHLFTFVCHNPRRRRIDSMFDQSPPRQTGRRTRLAFRKKWSFMWCFSENRQFYDRVVSLKTPNGWYIPENIQKTNIKAKKPKILPTFFFHFLKKKNFSTSTQPLPTFGFFSCLLKLKGQTPFVPPSARRAKSWSNIESIRLRLRQLKTSENAQWQTLYIQTFFYFVHY